ncbi:DUF4190 domain-containing protein [Nocardioides cavernaquae]|uniref:DUF4190 domain-containing protein n=1 Tax=Nocardioides cavernaquae TaxID=2321396 RepID=A0A3A5HEJ0_9ACTN|nr:DUF4190 domain-containing protein [Nocardioides cavernaquae]RJS46464.1 DUF4190 domain-containing protein [Nocardioides cavernaquae]
MTETIAPVGAPPKGGSGLAITALVIGIVSLLFCWVPIINNLFAVTAIVGIVLGFLAVRRAKKGKATGTSLGRAGLWISVVALVGVFATQALYAAFFNSVADSIDDSIEKSDAKDKEPGGPDNPLTITPGKAFEVSGFSYAAGWTLGRDVLGDIDVSGLKITNNRDEKDGAFVEIKFWKGTEVLASVDCSSDQIDVGTTAGADCSSMDKMPAAYDKLTINDTF